MLIQIENTPNPQVIKFIPEKAVLPVDNLFQESLSAGKVKVSFNKGDNDVGISPLANSLLEIDGVENIYLGADFISVTKMSDFDWSILKPMILGTIMDHYVNQVPIYLVDRVSCNLEDISNDPISQQIKAIIDEKVRPAVAADGGDIKFYKFSEGIVYVKMQGACSGCPSAAITLKSGIENMLRYYIPEVQEVQQIEN